MLEELLKEKEDLLNSEKGREREEYVRKFIKSMNKQGYDNTSFLKPHRYNNDLYINAIVTKLGKEGFRISTNFNSHGVECWKINW